MFHLRRGNIYPRGIGGGTWSKKAQLHTPLPLRLKQSGQNCLDLSQLSFNDKFKDGT